MKSVWIIPLSILFGGIVVAGALYIVSPKPTATETTSEHPERVRPVSTSDHILGNPAAPVVIVEYSDFECTFCKDFNETLHHIIANEGAQGKVAWVYREFPLTEIHPNALSHARVAECVAQTAGNDAFWKFTDALFKNQPVNPTQYGSIASSVGIVDDAFATCFSNPSPAIDARIMADRQNALDMGANGTPFSIMLIAGKPPVLMKGAYPYAAVKQLIDEALSSGNEAL